MAIDERDQLIALGDEEGVGAQKECARPLSDKVSKGRFNL